MSEGSRNLFGRLLAAVWILGAAFPACADVVPEYDLDRTGLLLGHIAVSVRDIDRSIRFYEALGFEVSGTRSVRSGVAKTLEVDGEFQARLGFVSRDGVLIELVEVESPRVAEPASGGVAFRLGLAHIAIHVDDVDRVAVIVRANGGKTLDHTRTKGAGRDLLFCMDPDGTRIELAWIDPAVIEEINPPPRGVRK